MESVREQWRSKLKNMERAEGEESLIEEHDECNKCEEIYHDSENRGSR